MRDGDAMLETEIRARQGQDPGNMLGLQKPEKARKWCPAGLWKEVVRCSLAY